MIQIQLVLEGDRSFTSDEIISSIQQSDAYYLVHNGNYYYTNQIKKSSKIISKIDFKTLSFIDKIKIILFIILINLKKIIKI